MAIVNIAFVKTWDRLKFIRIRIIFFLLVLSHLGEVRICTFPWTPTERAMERKGMTAIVRGLPDSGLMVTLVDDGGQYTLMPRTELEEPTSRVHNACSGMTSRHSQSASKDAGATRCDTGAQAADGRYASSYKMEYCHLQPTSPPVELTEFPPQRVRPDLVSTRMSRDSATSSAFADSLRKYPSVSPDSSEVVERLLNYSKDINREAF
ncbi:unnamed protein product, partial [Iphiclides podalirius]